jgi:hypothetical protein
MPQVVKKQFTSRGGEWVEVGIGGSLSDHISAADPHPQYATDADVAAAAAAAKAAIYSTPLWLYRNSATAQAGNPDIMPYLHASVTLTPGSWIVQGGVGCYNLTTEDASWGGLWSDLYGLVSWSGGGQSSTTTATASCKELRSAMKLIKVATGSMVVHPCAWRNGGSTLQSAGATQGPSGWISAIRIGM